MSSKKTPVLVGLGLAVVLIVLFALPRFTDPKRGLASLWKNAGVECLAMGHSNVSQHFHPHLAIIVDGAQEDIPTNMGVLNNCMAEIHTHDGTGTIHVETLAADKAAYLKDFFTVYGKPIQREGYAVSMTVDGQPNPLLGELVLADKQQIVLEYKSNGQK